MWPSRALPRQKRTPGRTDRAKNGPEARPAPDPGSTIRGVELWERSATLDLLDDLLRESTRGGRVAVVAGEAGIGKSVLVTEFARRCGARVLWGGCDRLVTPRALGPLHDIGRQAGGVLADRLGAGAAQEEIFAAFLEELSGPRQRSRPVVVVEDVHWADEATLDWLVWLGRRIGRLPALLVVTYRDDEVGAEHPLRGALAALPSALVRRVRLQPLSRACVTEQAGPPVHRRPGTGQGRGRQSHSPHSGPHHRSRPDDRRRTARHRPHRACVRCSYHRC